MKKIIFSAAFITATIANAQETQTWTTDLINISTETEAKLGTGSNHSVNFYTAGEKQMTIDTDEGKNIKPCRPQCQRQFSPYVC